MDYIPVCKDSVAESKEPAKDDRRWTPYATGEKGSQVGTGGSDSGNA